MCFDQLLMRAAAAAAAEEDDDRAQSKGCWEGNGDQADLRQTDKQGLGGANAASLLPPPQKVAGILQASRVETCVPVVERREGTLEELRGKWPWKEKKRK